MDTVRMRVVVLVPSAFGSKRRRGARLSERGVRIGSVLAIALAAAIFPGVRFGAMAALAVFAVVLVVGLVFTALPGWRREKITSAPFPQKDRDVLLRDVDAYRKLGAKERARFESDVAIFLAEQNVTGPRGEKIDEDLRVLVAASATIVAFGRAGFRYPRTRDVVVYEGAFDEGYRVGADAEEGAPILGMVHGSGPILFSARALRDGFRNTHDGLNVGLHEFAHVLDFDGGRADGVPGFMPWSAVKPWLHVMHDETRRIEHHRSILREYGATNEAEFFAVATEMFFEQPARMKEKQPKLYGLMVATYGQDPAPK